MNIVAIIDKVRFDKNQIGENKKTNSNDPITKSNWSSKIMGPPLGTPIDLFKKDAKTSPNMDPMGNSKMTMIENTGGLKEDIKDEKLLIKFNKNAIRIPHTIPDIVPFIVFPSPRILFPRKECPMSNGVEFFPKMAATLFGTYAGSIIQIEINSREVSPIIY